MYHYLCTRNQPTNFPTNIMRKVGLGKHKELNMERQEMKDRGPGGGSRKKVSGKPEDYEAFVEKFRPKKTTDDCYTPEEVYEAVVEWVDENIMPLEGRPIVRPFWPGGDYENHPYPEGCIVIDNPPFSCLAKIRRFFHSRGIKYFLFAPALTVASSAMELAPETCFILANGDIVYENGAVVRTSFVTNLDCGGTGVWIAGDLHRKVSEASDRAAKQKRAELPKYAYPDTVLSGALAGRIATRGISLRIPREETAIIGRIDANKSGVYGGGWLISERAAAERAAARRVTFFELSQREMEIVRGLESK